MTAFHRMRGPGDFDAPAELERDPGPIWGDLGEVETVLADSEFFADGCVEIMAEFITSGRDSYAEAKFMREMRVLADRCEAHINALDGES